MALTLDQLLIIKTAAECGSFSAAARRLGKAQSTVSSTICNIEREAGVVLFERGSKFLALTSVGQDLLKHINNIISQANNLEGKLNACAAEIEDNLSIIIDPAIPYTLVAPTVRAFCEQFPYVNLHIESMNLNDALASLHCGRVKLALLITLPNYPTDIGFCRLGTLQIAEVAHIHHPLSQLSSISFADLSNYRQLVFSPHGDNLVTSEYLRSSQRIYIDNYTTLIQMTLAGFGWSILPRPIVNDYVARGQMVELPLESYPYTKWEVGVDLLWNVKARPGPAAEWLKEIFSTQFFHTK
ncbi:LysR family transcriptional regulator [Endozoicomonas atrinae]|uniref:LysR family transcriptional regulator n=1 Tax=Endozoicomonas atrinae TaxID=1333660 RepID=UPI000825449E|nr:LysR family transcriptional regulator [Endozoicomonas atrinae]